MPQRLEVGEDSLETVDSFYYLGDVISCGGGVESAARDRISCAWSKRRELASLLVNHSIPPEKRSKVYCTCEACIAGFFFSRLLITFGQKRLEPI